MDSTAPVSQSRLLLLPGELRNEIFKYALISKSTVHIAPKNVDIRYWGFVYARVLDFSLFYVNKQIHHEAYGLFLASNTFEFSPETLVPSQLFKYLRNPVAFAASPFAAMRNIVLRAHPPEYPTSSPSTHAPPPPRVGQEVRFAIIALWALIARYWVRTMNITIDFAGREERLRRDQRLGGKGHPSRSHVQNMFWAPSLGPLDRYLVRMGNYFGKIKRGVPIAVELEKSAVPAGKLLAHYSGLNYTPEETFELLGQRIRWREMLCWTCGVRHEGRFWGNPLEIYPTFVCGKSGDWCVEVQDLRYGLEDMMGESELDKEVELGRRASISFRVIMAGSTVDWDESEEERLIDDTSLRFLLGPRAGVKRRRE